MSKLLIALLAVLALLPLKAVADHNPSGLLPGLPTPVIKRAMARGYVTYGLDANTSSYPNFRSQALQVAEAGLREINIPAYETSENPDIWLVMPEDSTFISICGNGASGCIVYWADPIIIYFRRALLYTDWRSTIGHEGINYGHAFGEHEQYDDRNFLCTMKRWTVMDCGNGVWQPKPFDVGLVLSVVLPPGANGSSLDTTSLYAPAIWYGSSARFQATRVAVFIQTLGFPLVWAGFWGPVSSVNIEGVRVPLLPDTCYYIGVENGLPASWGRHLQLAGCT
jgi:hypothetical protein